MTMIFPNKKTYKYFIALIPIWLCLIAGAQDPHFTQFYNVYQQYNPAYSGAVVGDVRASLNYRRQWFSGMKGYGTQAADAGINFYGKDKKPNYFSSGLFVLNDQAGKSQLKTFQVLGSVVYHIRINRKDKMSAGMQLGYLQKSIDLEGLSWDAQYDGSQYDPSMDNRENISSAARSSAFDIAPGVKWEHTGKNEYSFGYAFHHVGQDISLLNSGSDRFPIRQSLIGHFVQKGHAVSVHYDMLIQRQKTAMELNAGLRAEYRVGQDSRYTDASRSSAIYGGVYYRYLDSVSPVIGFEWQRSFSLFVSYDFPLSGVQRIVGMNGGPEIALIYNGFFAEKKKLIGKS